WEIDSMVEDKEITPYEIDKMSALVDEITFVTNRLGDNHKENARVINKITDIYRNLEELVDKLKYTEDIEARFGQTYTAITKTGYTIYEDKYYEILNTLSSLLGKRKKADKSEEISKLEREFINIANILGKILDYLTFNVLYVKPPHAISEFMNSLEILKATIVPIYTLIKYDYYSTEIEEAKTGLKKLYEEEEIKLGESIHIKGLFGRKEGINELEELSEIFRSID
ncbi:MAG: hypothetical protein ACXABK_04290, partial [Candidatus Heimdallarchaeaceae archaeon]